jgi:ribosome-associated protein
VLARENKEDYEGLEPGATAWFPAAASSIMPASAANPPQNGKPLETRQFQLRDDHVRLCDLLKLAGIVGSGGEGKRLVAGGEVTVDGQAESRKTAKIRAGQAVECRGVRILVLAAD